jgi:hypothetical protein
LPASVVQSGTGLWFAEQTVASLCGAIERLESHPDWFDPELARRQAERFSLPRFEQEIVACLDDVAAEGVGEGPEASPIPS